MTTAGSGADLPVVVATDQELAALKMELRGIRLRPGADTVELTVTAHEAEQAAQTGSLIVADEEGHPLATVTAVRIETGAAGTLTARGTARPTDPDAWIGPDTRGARLVIAHRPLLLSDTEELRAERGSTVVIVPTAGPSPDGLPAAVLEGVIRAALDGTAVRVLPLEIAWQLGAPADQAAALAETLGAASVAVLDPADPGWTRLLAALDDEGPAPALAAEAVLTGLRRWRSPLARRGLVVLFTGLSGSGKSTLAQGLTRWLADNGRSVSLLDGDRVRRLLSAGLGFDRASRDLNVRRIGFVAAEVARHGGVAVCAPIAPYAESRAAVRALAAEVGDFVLVHVSTPLEECERRDVKGLYARARTGELPSFTGISDPYEVPGDADVTLDTSRLSEHDALARLTGFLRARGWIGGAANP
ncbi:MAG: sulfate adenylyltransferase [Actinomycetota bacterium]|nr:sulfate adenylyltransferase [Actinomycetota bacterium]